MPCPPSGTNGCLRRAHQHHPLQLGQVPESLSEDPPLRLFCSSQARSAKSKIAVLTLKSAKRRATGCPVFFWCLTFVMGGALAISARRYLAARKSEIQTLAEENEQADLYAEKYMTQEDYEKVSGILSTKASKRKLMKKSFRITKDHTILLKEIFFRDISCEPRIADAIAKKAKPWSERTVTVVLKEEEDIRKWRLVYPRIGMAKLGHHPEDLIDKVFKGRAPIRTVYVKYPIPDFNELRAPFNVRTSVITQWAFMEFIKMIVLAEMNVNEGDNEMVKSLRYEFKQDDTSQCGKLTPALVLTAAAKLAIEKKSRLEIEIEDPSKRYYPSIKMFLRSFLSACLREYNCVHEYIVVYDVLPDESVREDYFRSVCATLGCEALYSSFSLAMGPLEAETKKNEEEYFRFQPWLAHRLGFTTRAEVAEVNGRLLHFLICFVLSLSFAFSHSEKIFGWIRG